MNDHLDPEIEAQLAQLVPTYKEYLEECKLARRLYRGPKVLKSDSSFSLAGVSYKDTPVLVNAYGDIIEEPSQWLIYMRTMSTSAGSVLQYASSLCSFWRHLQQVARKQWHEVDDALLQGWRNKMVAGVSRENLQKRRRTVNKKLYVVLGFYRWSQELGYVKDIIGLTPPGGQPYPIRLIEVVHKQQRRITSPLLYKERRAPVLPVPTLEEIDLLYIHLAGPKPVDQRDVLLARWTLDSGMRESEVLDRLVDELPTPKHCQALKDAGRLYWMPIIGKGDAPRLVPVSPDVLLETHAFITGAEGVPSARDLMLAQRKKTSYEGHIFLSSTTGEPLKRQSVSHIFSRIFLLVTGRPDRRGLHYHRLRARFASTLVQELALGAIEKGYSIYDPAEQQLILERAADILGHQDVKSLRYYLNTFVDKHDAVTAAAAAKSRRG
jgi:site-specific recombinase XerD